MRKNVGKGLLVTLRVIDKPQMTSFQKVNYWIDVLVVMTTPGNVREFSNLFILASSSCSADSMEQFAPVGSDISHTLWQNVLREGTFFLGGEGGRAKASEGRVISESEH